MGDVEGLETQLRPDNSDERCEDLLWRREEVEVVICHISNRFSRWRPCCIRGRWRYRWRNYGVCEFSLEIVNIIISKT